jgi:hypothetical protein
MYTEKDGGVVDENWGMIWSCLDAIDLRSSFFSPQILSFVVVAT